MNPTASVGSSVMFDSKSSAEFSAFLSVKITGNPEKTPVIVGIRWNQVYKNPTQHWILVDRIAYERKPQCRFKQNLI